MDPALGIHPSMAWGAQPDNIQGLAVIVVVSFDAMLIRCAAAAEAYAWVCQPSGF